MAEKDKKYYWLKLKRDFFKRHDIQIVEGMPNGKDYILFYLKLLCESVDHEGCLRFSEQIPYNEQMLSILTNTNIDVVRSAIKIFSELGMLEVLDDGTVYMNAVQKMIGCASQDEHTRESTRLRVQAYRERQKQFQIGVNRYSNVTCNGEIEKEIELDIEKDKEKVLSNDNTKKKKFTPPSVSEVAEYCKSVGSQVDAEAFVAFYESKDWFVGKNKMKSWRAAITTWEKRNGLKRIVVTEKPKEIIQPEETMNLWGDD